MENKHNKYTLAQYQSLPLDAKIRMTQERIRAWYEYWDAEGAGCYVSFSGGKDSIVLKHIVDNMYDDVPSVFVDTGLEYPEIKELINDIKNNKYKKFGFNNNIEVLRPEKSFNQVIKEYGYPVISKEVAQVIAESKKILKSLNKKEIKYSYSYRRLKGLGEYAKTTVKNKRYTWEEQQALSAGYPNSDRSSYNCSKYEYLLDAPFNIDNKCCDIMKKKPFKKYEKEHNRKGFVGTMAYESFARKQAWIKTGCNAFNSSRPKSSPLSFWTEQDILQYIKIYNLPIAKVYGDIVINDNNKLELTGVNRTGCMFCMFGVHLEKEPNRFQQMKSTHPQLYDYCINKLNLKEVLEFIGVPYE